MYLFIYLLIPSAPFKATAFEHVRAPLGTAARQQGTKAALRFQCTLVLSNRQEGEQGGKKKTLNAEAE